MQTFFGQMEGNRKRIGEIVAETMRKRVAENRKKIIPIMKIGVLCGRQNIAFWGQIDDAKHIADKSINSGNFQALLEFRIDSGDEGLRQHFETAPKNATYRSKTIQNEIIASCGKLIQGKLIAEIKKATFYTITADDATGTGNKEQLALVIRFVDESGQIREEFLEFIQIQYCAGNNIVEQLKSAIKKYGLDMNFLLGQSYDGAGNMAGAKSGTSSNILRSFPKYLYFHCSAHRLNLVVAETCKILSVINMMDCIRKCSQIFEFSPKKTRITSESY